MLSLVEVVLLLAVDMGAFDDVGEGFDITGVRGDP